MTEDETATGEGMPEPPAPPAPEPPAASDTARLSLAGPSWCTAMRLALSDGSTLSVDRRGVDVPADQAQTLIKTAATYGVTITEVSEQ